MSDEKITCGCDCHWPEVGDDGSMNALPRGQDDPCGRCQVAHDWHDPDLAQAQDDIAAPIPERAGREGDTQPLPKGTDGPIMHEIVIEALKERLAVGIRRYGQPLQAFNGRDPAQDAFEEVLDLSVYLAQARIEREAHMNFFRDLVATFGRPLELVQGSQVESNPMLDALNDFYERAMAFI